MGFFDHETCRPESAENPLGARVGRSAGRPVGKKPVDRLDSEDGLQLRCKRPRRREMVVGRRERSERVVGACNRRRRNLALGVAGQRHAVQSESGKRNDRNRSSWKVIGDPRLSCLLGQAGEPQRFEDRRQPRRVAETREFAVP